MIKEELKKIKSGKTELRKFGILIGIILGILGSLFFWKEKDFYTYILVFSFLFLSGGILFPILLWPVHKVWMTAAILIGWVVTRIILIVLFYLVVTPIGFFIRISGKDLLNSKFDNNVNSYWLKRNKTPQDKDSYERQF